MTPQEQAGYIPSLEREPTMEEQKLIDTLDATNNRLGWLAKTARLAAGWGLREFAELCGIEPSRYCDFEHGRAKLTDEQWAKLVVAYESKREGWAECWGRGWPSEERIRDLAAKVSGDDEQCDQEWLELNQFKFDVNDGNCLWREITNSGLYVAVTIDRDGLAKCLSLGWKHYSEKVGMVYQLEDQPTKGRVRKLLEALS